MKPEKPWNNAAFNLEPCMRIGTKPTQTEPTMHHPPWPQTDELVGGIRSELQTILLDTARRETDHIPVACPVCTCVALHRKKVHAILVGVETTGSPGISTSNRNSPKIQHISKRYNERGT